MSTLLVALALLVASGCLLDTDDIVGDANVVLQIEEVSPVALRLQAEIIDSAAVRSIKEPELAGASAVEIHYARIAEGRAEVLVLALGGSSEPIQCRHLVWVIPKERVEIRVDLGEGGLDQCPGAAADGDGGTEGDGGTGEAVDDGADGGDRPDCGPDEETIAMCIDGLDNDCDGVSDCADPACNLITAACSNGPCQGDRSWNCASATWGVCDAPTAVPESDDAQCNDGRDNDCDGLTDCEDDGCFGKRRACGEDNCAGSQICSDSGWGNCLPIQPIPENNNFHCHDESDNDCDGLTDCTDPDCACAGCGC